MSERFLPGSETWYASDSPHNAFSAVFEDDGQTAYFYAYNRAARETPILDAVHVYNVANVVDRQIESLVEIIWSQDGLKASLLINDFPHAVLDFVSQTAYCRTGFPPASKTWHRGTWDDALMRLFDERA
jgi:hypothetical protein